MINGEDSSYFKTGKGLRQGDPLSPFLFNLVGDGFSKLLSKAVSRGVVQGLLRDFRAGGFFPSNMLMIPFSFLQLRSLTLGT
jgi:hypothetical protein